MKLMNMTRFLSLVALLFLAASPVFAFSLDDVTNAASAVSGGSGNVAASPQMLELVQSLNSLNLTPEQAVGGTGAMLDLAKNQLPSGQYSQLTHTVPGLEQLVGSNGLQQLNGLGGLLGPSTSRPLSSEATVALSNVNDRQGLNQAFSALGMDSDMIDQFTPLLLQYFGREGVDASLLDSLGRLWAAGGA